MEFLKVLEETQSSIEFKKNADKLLTFGSYEEMGSRFFEHLYLLDEGVAISIQASYAHYCKPTLTLPIENYTHMEIAFIKDNDFLDIGNVIDDKQLVEDFEIYYDGTVYAFVPIEIIERLYKYIIGG